MDTLLAELEEVIHWGRMAVGEYNKETAEKSVTRVILRKLEALVTKYADKERVGN